MRKNLGVQDKAAKSFSKLNRYIVIFISGSSDKSAICSKSISSDVCNDQ